MNILTIGVSQKISALLNMFTNPESKHMVKHTINKSDALGLIKDNRRTWDWIIIQGHDDPEKWKSILCAVNANASNTPITVLSSHIDGTRLKTPVCSMHNNGHDLSITRCAMQSMLQEDKPAINVQKQQDNTRPTPIVFEYHAPCRS